MLVVDFMHEFELGAWKALYKHLIRILFVHGNSTISALNERYRAVPTFGRSNYPAVLRECFCHEEVSRA